MMVHPRIQINHFKLREFLSICNGQHGGGGEIESPPPRRCLLSSRCNGGICNQSPLLIVSYKGYTYRIIPLVQQNDTSTTSMHYMRHHSTYRSLELIFYMIVAAEHMM